jgi:serine protease inhibitor
VSDDLDEHLKKGSAEIIESVIRTFTPASASSFHEKRQGSTRRLRHLKYGVSTVALAAAVVVSTLALTGGSSTPTPAVETSPTGRLVSEVARVAPESGTAYAHAVQQAEVQFSNVFMSQLIEQNPFQNVTASPLGLSTALQMVIAGADLPQGSNLESKLGVQHLTGTEALLGWDALDAQIARDAKDSKTSFHNADSLWIQKGFSVGPSFLETLKQYFGTGVGQVNFSQSETASSLINKWVSDNTEGKINDFTSAAQFSASSKLFLANALFFSAPWFIPFESRNTTPAPFLTGDGSTVTVPTMMSGQELLKAAITPSFTAVDLSYNGGKFDALIIEPKSTGLKSLRRHVRCLRERNRNFGVVRKHHPGADQSPVLLLYT